jgi:hypothetical protein
LPKISIAALLVALAMLSSFGAFGALTPASFAHPPKDVGIDYAGIQNAYDRINQAFAENHVARMTQLIADDYSQTDPKGRVLDKQGLLKKLQWERDSISTVQYKCSITGVTQDPRGLMVDMTMHTSGNGVKRVLFMKFHGTFTNDLVVKDLWVKTATGWRIKTRCTLLDESHQQAG